MIRVSTLKHWKGILSIIVATAAPFGAWGTGDSTLRGAIVVGGVAGLSALYNWIDRSLEEARQAKLADDAEVDLLNVDPSVPPSDEPPAA